MNYSEVTKTLSNNNDLTTPPNASHKTYQRLCTIDRDNNNKSLMNANKDLKRSIYCETSRASTASIGLFLHKKFFEINLVLPLHYMQRAT